MVEQKAQLHALWRELDRLLSFAVTKDQELLPSGHVAQVREFIDHNEFGLALEVLSEAFACAGPNVSTEARAAATEAALLMMSF